MPGGKATTVSSSLPRRHRRGLTRSAAACERCRRRKQKCDARTPTCGACKAAGASCVPSERLVVRQAHPECQCGLLRDQLQTLRHQYETLLQQFEQLQGQTSGKSPRSNSNAPDASGPSPSGIISVSRSHVSPMHEEWRKQNLIFNCDIPYTGRILLPTFSHRSRVRDTNGSALSSAWKLWGDDPGLVDAPLRLTTIPPESDSEAYLKLVGTFFDRRWPYLPVLHRPTFLREHLSPFLSRRVSSGISRFLVNMVCAIATAEKPLHQEESHYSHRAFFNQATQDMHLVIGTGDFECVQCLLLLCMYGYNEPQSVNLWYTSGLALQLAIGIDLHRKESLAGRDNLSAEMVKRVFWSAYVTNCIMAINMGRPLGIQESDITMSLPLQLTDDELDNSPAVLDHTSIVPQVTDTSTFIHIIRLRKINAVIYSSFHSIGQTRPGAEELESRRKQYFSDLNHWVSTAPRYMQTTSTFQSPHWFQIAFHHAVLTLYRPSRGAPMPSSEDLRICTESAIGLISSYSALYAMNQIKYTFVAIHALFMAAITMLYALRASPQLRHDLTKSIVQTNILTFLTLFRGISNGRMVGEKCSEIVERLGDCILSLFDDATGAGVDVDTEFQSWFGLQSHAFTKSAHGDSVKGMENKSPDYPDARVDLPWADLFLEGIDIGSTDVWSFLT
ncbi:hypothetical protein BO94DRAFT_587225 [Aspergillus sclerotioniger CBS 115572]|uniref:Zn(2)-C6 fungal-type domain-containing protein n=1 Tax=Aspergillus sclerotioniger CBS 115572 TaxID=1450535 RepID=A0A317W8E6_9EURO|nr:hypothetical protein BO94DRAFT_587225 [Aspergillus sclerotioniger CBS 115572]PWY81512.1 hypothetical protein BO94DRAFT_587225 [Aspergillus sclerotioniger CBS 115572]